MAAYSKIGWTTHTFNPWIGCSKVSDGCKFCYAAEDTPARVSRANGIELWGPNAARKLKAIGDRNGYSRQYAQDVKKTALAKLRKALVA